MNAFNLIISMLLTNAQSLGLPIVDNLLETIGASGSSQSDFSESNSQTDSSLTTSSQRKTNASQAPIKLAADLNDKAKSQPITPSSDNQRNYDSESQSREDKHAYNDRIRSSGNYNERIRGTDDRSQREYDSYGKGEYGSLAPRSQRNAYPDNYDSESSEKGSRSRYPRYTKSKVEDYNGYDTNERTRDVRDENRESDYKEDHDSKSKYSKFNAVNYAKYDTKDNVKGMEAGYKTGHGKSDEKGFNDDDCDENDTKDFDKEYSNTEY